MRAKFKGLKILVGSVVVSCSFTIAQSAFATTMIDNVKYIEIIPSQVVVRDAAVFCPYTKDEKVIAPGCSIDIQAKSAIKELKDGTRESVSQYTFSIYAKGKDCKKSFSTKVKYRVLRHYCFMRHFPNYPVCSESEPKRLLNASSMSDEEVACHSPMKYYFVK